MRVPRPRLTVRRSMLLMVALALALNLGLAFYRHREFTRRAKACLTLASLQEDSAKWERQNAPGGPNQDPTRWALIGRFDRRAAHFRRWAGLFEDAAKHPWRVGPTPEPAPE